MNKLISKITVLLVMVSSVVITMSVSASDSAITVSDGKAIVGNDMQGVAIVASYNENGRLTNIVTAPVEKGCFAKFDVKKGDKVMFWSGLETMNPLADAVTVTGNEYGSSNIYNKTMYEKSVQNALCEALGKSKGKGMTDIQKAVALHDWLVVNCQYDVTVSRTYCHSKYGAIVEGYAVCDGYAKAFNDLLSRVGVKAKYMEGRKTVSPGGEPQPHAWSVVVIDGKEYYVDVTADDPVSDVPGRVGRRSFLVSEDVLKNAGYYWDSDTHPYDCYDKTYEKNDMLHGYHVAFIWNENIGKFYYIDMDKVKTTSDFSETLVPSSKENGVKPSSCIMTKDGKFFYFFKPTFNPDLATVHLYSFETDKYYSYTVKGIEEVIACRIRQNGDNVEVVRDYYKNEMPFMVKAEVSVPVPEVLNNRRVTFDQNYDGGKVTSCEYISNYWTNGDGSFDELQRQDLTFDGWYTERYSGTKIENFEEIPDDNMTLYAHWWGPWKISAKPTLTESGKAVRAFDGHPNVTEEITIPNLSDTSVWEKKFAKPATEDEQGTEVYVSEYGTVVIKLPKLPKKYDYGIFYERGTVYITIPDDAAYQVKFESGGKSATLKTASGAPGKYPVACPKSVTPVEKLTVTLYDMKNNELCTAQFDV